ncbi:MAG: metallophosphoesterase family protein [Anaerolineae bacterium]|nr:metallophosphoesterase family protein [Anaerolineae bacterium]
MITLAILADIHGNRTALQAVFNDLERRGGADHIIVLGDLAVFGPDPAGVLRLLQAYEPIFHVAGNTDRYLVEKRYPPDPHDEGWRSQVLASFPWTADQLGQAGLRFLARLPYRQVLNFTGEHPILAVHGSPRSDEENISPDTPEVELGQMLRNHFHYNLLLCAHTHVPLDRRSVAGQRVVNVGSVGLPFDNEPRASYVLIQLAPGGEYRVEMRRVAYDVEAVIAQLFAVDHPAAEVQAYNLRTARRLDPQLIYTNAMRQRPVVLAKSKAQKDFQSAVLLSRLAQVSS